MSNFIANNKKNFLYLITYLILVKYFIIYLLDTQPLWGVGWNALTSYGSLRPS